MTSTTITIPANDYETSLSLAYAAIRQLLKAGDSEGFALTSEGRWLFHEQKIPLTLINLIEPKHKLAVLQEIATQVEMRIEEIEEYGRGDAA